MDIQSLTGVTMNTAYMCYFEHLAKLSIIANKQTLFLARMLYLMEFNIEAKQFVVNLTTAQKRDIVNAVSPDSKNPLNLAKQYILKLVQANIIKPLGGGQYLVNPECYGGGKYVPKGLRTKNSAIYETRVFKADTESGAVESAYIITDDGEKVDLT
jgi:hypothetical protein